MQEHLKKLIESSERILITSHIGPDGDAVASSLLLYGVLRDNYPGKTIMVALEEKPFGLDFLNNIEQIKLGPLPESVSAFRPDLIFILDANTVTRLSRQPEKTRAALKDSGAKLIIIDHHEPDFVEPNDLYINNQSPAVTLDIYELFLIKMGLQKPEGYAQTAMTGIYTDTGGFINRNLNFEKTFKAVPDLIKDGADIESIANQLKRITVGGARVFTEIMNNLKLNDGFTYSSISDETAGDEKNLEAVRQAADLFRNEIIRNIEGRPWGFLIYKDVLAPGSTYSVSFRALAGTKDVSRYAQALGGGGHKPAAGAKFQAESLDEALEKVKKTIFSI